MINTRKEPSEVDLGVAVRCAAVDATSVALEHIKAPIVNTSILGSMAKVQDLVSLDSIKAAIADRFGERLGKQAADINAAAAQASFDRTKVGMCQGNRVIAHREMWLPKWNEIPIGVTLPPGIVRQGRRRTGQLLAEHDRDLADQLAALPQGEVHPLPALLVQLPGGMHPSPGGRSRDSGTTATARDAASVPRYAR